MRHCGEIKRVATDNYFVEDLFNAKYQYQNSEHAAGDTFLPFAKKT